MVIESKIKLSERFKLDGCTFEVCKLSEEGLLNLRLLELCDKKISEINNLMAVARRVKNGYISDMKIEIASGKSGIDFSTLLGE